MSEWKEVLVEDACSHLSSGKSISSTLIKEAAKYPVYGGNGIRGFTDSYNFEGECAIIGRQGASCGNVRYFSGKAYMTEHAVVAVPTEKHNAYYLSCVLASLKLGRLSGQSAQPGIGVGLIGRQSITMPLLATQKNIASILTSFDSKIECNRKICANLEAQAQTLFKHWFVDFAPFKDGKFVESELGLIPEGWRVGYLSDVLDLIKETTNQGERPELPYLPIDSIPMNSFLLNEVKDNSEAQSSLLLFKKDDILVGAMRVYFHRVVPAPFDGITRSTCFVLRPKCDEYFSFALCVANSNDAIQYAQKTSKGSTMPYAVWDGGLGSYCTIIPPKSILKDFNILLKKDIDLIQNMYFENNRLSILRDTLLPKLMSGQIKV